LLFVLLTSGSVPDLLAAFPSLLECLRVEAETSLTDAREALWVFRLFQFCLDCDVEGTNQLVPFLVHFVMDALANEDLHPASRLNTLQFYSAVVEKQPELLEDRFEDIVNAVFRILCAADPEEWPPSEFGHDLFDSFAND
jgi:hypothetical protein